jgi:hypothetical protein
MASARLPNNSRRQPWRRGTSAVSLSATASMSELEATSFGAMPSCSHTTLSASFSTSAAACAASLMSSRPSSGWGSDLPSSARPAATAFRTASPTRELAMPLGRARSWFSASRVCGDCTAISAMASSFSTRERGTFFSRASRSRQAATSISTPSCFLDAAAP